MIKNEKIVIVTGASRGIGRGISLMLAENNCTVVAVGTKENPPQDYLKELTDRSPHSLYIKADISREADCVHLVNEVEKQFGNIDFHINNAGIAPSVRADILETTKESFDRLLDVNLKGTFFLTQKIANLMIKNTGGTEIRGIINISSMSAYTASVSRPEYCISKAGISMITALFADRLAEFGINVYEVRPGIIQTDMTSGVLDKYNKLINDGLLPISRLGQPEDVAKAVLAVVNGLLPYSTGEIINVDGGFHIRRL